MNYCYVENNVVKMIIPEFDETFPNVPITKRYSAEMISKLVKDESETVGINYIYNSETNTFDEPLVMEFDTIKPIPENLDRIKDIKITESKVQLAEWLKSHPMLYSDNKYYSVTEEKQSLLNSNLASCERAKVAGIEYPLHWNATGEECVPWEYDELVALSLAIAGYVAPKVAKQQAIEIEIKSCETIDELEAVVISYD